MHIRFFAFLFAASLLGGAAAVASDNSGGRVFDITAQNGSGEHGTVALKPRGDKTVVEVHIIGAPKTPQPAHIHLGTCDKLDPAPKYPLTPIVDGISETTVDASIATLTATAMAVNVHKSADDIKTYVACGNL